MNGIADLNLVQFRINHSNTERILASEIWSGLNPPQISDGKILAIPNSSPWSLAFTSCYLGYCYKELTKSFDCHSFKEPNIDSCHDWRLGKLWGSKLIANLIWKLFIRGWQAVGKQVYSKFVLYVIHWKVEWMEGISKLVGQVGCLGMLSNMVFCVCYIT